MSVSSMLVNQMDKQPRNPSQMESIVLGKGGRPLKVSAERPGSEVVIYYFIRIFNATGLIINVLNQRSVLGGGYQSTITNRDRTI